MYLNEKLIARDIRSAKRKIIIGAVFAGFFAFGIVEGILGDEKLRADSPYYILMMLPFLALIYSGIRKQMKVGLCNRLNQTFIADADGLLPLSTLLKVMGTEDESKAEKTINRLISQGYLQYVSFDPARPHMLLLTSQTSGPRTVSTICLKCGATVERREGFSVTCPYCRTLIQ